MSLQSRLRFIWRYLRGDIPWNTGIVPPEIVAWVEAHAGSPGRALDLGCGTGTTSLYLASHGWDVVGVDFAPNAVAAARAKARREARRGDVSGSVEFHSADVSRPTLLAGHAPFDLLVDVGCLHAVDAPSRPGYAANLVRLAVPGATMLLYAWLPLIRRGRPMGIDVDGLRDMLNPAFEITDHVVGEETRGRYPSAWTWLRRTERAS
jgi:SAM-dependent methyltransferase